MARSWTTATIAVALAVGRAAPACAQPASDLKRGLRAYRAGTRSIEVTAVPQ